MYAEILSFLGSATQAATATNAAGEAVQGASEGFVGQLRTGPLGSFLSALGVNLGGGGDPEAGAKKAASQSITTLNAQARQLAEAGNAMYAAAQTSSLKAATTTGSGRNYYLGGAGLGLMLGLGLAVALAWKGK